jgi:hypothetical protein
MLWLLREFAMMFTCGFAAIRDWLSDHWLNIRVQWHRDRTDRMREDQEPYYTPLYRGRPFRRAVPRTESLDSLLLRDAAAHCCNCGHRGTVLVPDGQKPAAVENEILDMLECPVCGLYTMCSD